MEIRLGREAALLREILREKPDHGSAASLVRDTEWFDWDLFEELLFRSRVVPLVSATVSNDESFSDLLPEALCRRLHHEKERAIVRSILKAHELHQVLNRFQLNDIEPIVLKGLPFALRYFDDPAHRDVRDLDLLVAPEQLRPAERVLRSLG